MTGTDPTFTGDKTAVKWQEPHSDVEEATHGVFRSGKKDVFKNSAQVDAARPTTKGGRQEGEFFEGSADQRKNEAEFLELYTEKLERLIDEFAKQQDEATILKMIKLSDVYSDILYQNRYLVKVLLTLKMYFARSFERSIFKVDTAMKLLRMVEKVEGTHESYRKFVTYLVDEGVEIGHA